jgi:hypothetical protein
VQEAREVEYHTPKSPTSSPKSVARNIDAVPPRSAPVLTPTPSIRTFNGQMLLSTSAVPTSAPQGQAFSSPMLGQPVALMTTPHAQTFSGPMLGGPVALMTTPHAQTFNGPMMQSSQPPSAAYYVASGPVIQSS